jgi:ribosome-associated protein
LTSKQQAVLAAKIAIDTKAEDVAVLDMRKLSNYCDYFVICSAPSSRRVKAISEEIEEEFDKKGVRLAHQEGKSDSLWILLDYSGIVVHIFLSELRQFYNLEHLWSEAPRLKVS